MPHERDDVGIVHTNVYGNLLPIFHGTMWASSPTNTQKCIYRATNHPLINLHNPSRCRVRHPRRTVENLHRLANHTLINLHNPLHCRGRCPHRPVREQQLCLLYLVKKRIRKLTKISIIHLQNLKKYVSIILLLNHSFFNIP